MKIYYFLPVVFLLASCANQATNSYPLPSALMMQPPQKLLPVLTPEQRKKLTVDDHSPSGIALSSLTDTITKNYQLCNENSELLIDLQNWVLDQSKIK